MLSRVHLLVRRENHCFVHVLVHLFNLLDRWQQDHLSNPLLLLLDFMESRWVAVGLVLADQVEVAIDIKEGFVS